MFDRYSLQVLQRFGKSEETRDTQFEICVQNFQDQQVLHKMSTNIRSI